MAPSEAVDDGKERHRAHDVTTTRGSLLPWTESQEGSRSGTLTSTGSDPRWRGESTSSASLDSQDWTISTRAHQLGGVVYVYVDGLLVTAEDNTLDILYTYTSTLYNLRIPLTLTENRTSEICW